MTAAEVKRAASLRLRRILERLLPPAVPPPDQQDEINRRLLELARAQAAEVSRSGSTVEELRNDLSVLREEIGSMREWLQAASSRTDEMAGRTEFMRTEIEQERQRLKNAVSDLSHRIPAAVPLYGSETFALERFDAGLGGEVIGFRATELTANAPVYVGFEDFFRGPEELVRERQLAYIPLLSGRAPVLDIGCGRGEMLELLRDRGIEAAGIDVDPAMVERCRAKGLERVQVADAVRYLDSVEAGSLGAVFAAQVIEHLPYASLLQFLRDARRALRPGGLLVVETVNPHAPQALKHFWIDPTHQHPLFPEVVVALCQLTGFAAAYVWHPQGSGDPDRDRIEQPDYAVVAEAPATAASASAPM